MDINLFDFIKIKKKEDLTTSILDFLINQRHEPSISKIFFKRIEFNGKKFKTDPQLPIRHGYIDLFIDSDNDCSLIENKFDAPFTYSEVYGHQLVKYCNWLKNNHKDKNS